MHCMHLSQYNFVGIETFAGSFIDGFTGAFGEAFPRSFTDCFTGFADRSTEAFSETGGFTGESVG